jgi:hypothetical protein
MKKFVCSSVRVPYSSMPLHHNSLSPAVPGAPELRPCWRMRKWRYGVVTPSTAQCATKKVLASNDGKQATKGKPVPNVTFWRGVDPTALAAQGRQIPAPTPPARLALAPPPYNTGVYRSTSAPPGRSRSTSDCVSGPIFYLTPVCECRSGGSADRLGLWPLAWSFHGAAVEHRPIRRGTQANPPWNRLAVLTRQADRKQLCHSGTAMIAVADACVWPIRFMQMHHRR